MMTAKEYIDSLRKLNTRVDMFGEKIDNTDIAKNVCRLWNITLPPPPVNPAAK